MRDHKDTRVLIVEDNYLVSEVIKQLLHEAKYTVAGEAVDGLQAVGMVVELQPDVILMDIQMPDMNGIEATRLIYEKHPTPVVVLTAYETEELVEAASRVGVGAYLVKPATVREIERAITIAMARFEDMMELRRLNTELQTLNAELKEAIAKIKTLRGLIPICASCKKIRDDQGYWKQLEVYIRDHSEAEFSHGLCPECVNKLYPNLIEKE